MEHSPLPMPKLVLGLLELLCDIRYASDSEFTVADQRAGRKSVHPISARRVIGRRNGKTMVY